MRNFAKDYYAEARLDVAKMAPRLDVKFRDELCFKGKRVPYESVTKFVKRGETYIPLIVLSDEPKDGEIVMDMAPLLCAGVAETLSILSFRGAGADLDYFNRVRELEFTKNWEDMLQRMSELYDLDLTSNEHSIALTEGLRSSLVDSRFPLIRHIYTSLMALWWVCPKSFCTALLSVMPVTFPVLALFGAFELALTDATGCRVNAMSASVVMEKLTRYGAVKYTLVGREHTRLISDGRGLSISIFGMFMLDVYKRFGSASHLSASVFKGGEKSRADMERVFSSSLGDDFIGRLLKNGKGRIMSVDDDILRLANESDLVPLDCNIQTKWHGVDVGRGYYEAGKLWEYATGAQNVENVGVLPPVDVSYGNRFEILRACFWFVFSRRGIVLGKTLEDYSKEDLLSTIMTKMEVGKYIETIKRDIEERTEKEIVKASFMATAKIAEAGVLQEQVEMLQRELAEKQNIIKELSSENSSLRGKVKSMYSEQEFTEEQEAEEDSGVVVSTEDMLAFVNQFRLVLAGGQDILQQRMEAAGFTNFYFIANERVASNTLVAGDFFCLCTKFLPHKLAYNVEANYASQLDQFFYFNGSNVDILLRTCYDFMKGWFEAKEV